MLLCVPQKPPPDRSWTISVVEAQIDFFLFAERRFLPSRRIRFHDVSTAACFPGLLGFDDIDRHEGTDLTEVRAETL